MTFDDAMGQGLRDALNGDPRFAQAARWFDGSVLLQSDASQLWLKIYKGQVIDLMPFTPPLGYTFKIAGPATAWDALRSGARTFADLVTPGRRYFDDDPELTTLGEMVSDLVVEGNGIEANRMTEAQYLIAEHLSRPAAVAA